MKMYEGTQTTRVSVDIDLDTVDRLKELAARNFRPMTMEIRQAIANHIKREEQKSREPDGKGVAQ